MENSKVITIEGIEVILIDYSLGKGKIIISDPYLSFIYSYQWGAMGSDLKDFISSCDDDYLIGCLGDHLAQGEINIKSTMANVRGFIKNDTSWKWFMSPTDDKSLRQSLRHIQCCCHDQYQFVDMMQNLDLDKYYEGSNIYYNAEYEFSEMISMIRSEPWHFIELYEPKKNNFLRSFLPKLKEFLKNEGLVSKTVELPSYQKMDISAYKIKEAKNDINS